MIIIAELNHTKQAHIQYNASILSIFLRIVRFGKVCFVADRYHQEYILTTLSREQAAVNNLTTRNVKVSYSNHINRLYWIPRITFEWWNTLRVMQKARKANAPLVFFCSMFPTSIYFLNTILRRFFPDQKIIITLHGELELLKEKAGGVLQKLLLRGLLKKHNNTHYLVLGDSIKHNLLNTVPINQEQILTLIHPYFYSRSPKEQVTAGKDRPIRLAAIGLMAVYKKSHLIYRLAETLKEKVINNKIEFTIVGSLHKSILPYVNEWVKSDKSEELLEREEFEKRINQIDYAIYFYDNSYYQLCSSGAIFDAVNFEKPIISLRNDYFSEIFDKAGAIGYLCDSLEEMEEMIVRILRAGDLQYNTFVENMKAFKRNFSNEALGQEFARQLTEREIFV
ncbi:hypothetical protein [Chitinophaga sp. Ak27]|uniref:hypothetical protein n=1 Tax=Chitinophaga sp. Ak27 TaxID=2726116 RepID=UPI00145DE51C|nr:hypothetical protein [Chitinophaga sp. Ak27]NLU94413.1 hypothetical protein [Chitinophaga sp. Ak27]